MVISQAHKHQVSVFITAILYSTHLLHCSLRKLCKGFPLLFCDNTSGTPVVQLVLPLNARYPVFELKSKLCFTFCYKSLSWSFLFLMLYFFGSMALKCDHQQR